MSKMKWILILAVIAAAAGGGWWWKVRKGPSLPLEIVKTVAVEKGDVISSIEETGKLDPLTKVRIKSNATGVVKKLYVDAGSKVKKDQKLAVIQPGRPGEKYKLSTVISPLSGVVIERKVEEGDTVTSGLSDYGGGTEMLIISDLTNMLVNVEINEVDVNKIKIGQKAEVMLDALPKDVFPALIRLISPMAKAASGGSSVNVFDVQVRITGIFPQLKPGMSARVRIVADSRRGVLVLPVETVFDEDGQMAVYVMEGQKAVRKVVTTGLSDESNVEIVKGVAQGEMVSRVRPLEGTLAEELKKAKKQVTGDRRGHH